MITIGLLLLKYTEWYTGSVRFIDVVVSLGKWKCIHLSNVFLFRWNAGRHDLRQTQTLDLKKNHQSFVWFGPHYDCSHVSVAGDHI